MTKKQRNILLVIVLCVIAYGLISNQRDMTKNKSSSLAFYILRADPEAHHADGEQYYKEKTPVFTHEDIESYDPQTHSFHMTDDFLEKMDQGYFMSKDYLDAKEHKINKEDYWLNGISPLGAKYPDYFAIYIDDEEVLVGFFETPAYMSFMPEGRFIRTTDTGFTIELGYSSGMQITQVPEESSVEDSVIVLKIDENIKDTGFDKIEDYFLKN